MSESNSTKVLVPNKEWLIKAKDSKIGSISKNKKEYIFYRHGQAMKFNSLSEITTKFGITSFDTTQYKKNYDFTGTMSVYGYPCSTKPYDPMYSIKDRIPVFTKVPKSKSCYCAGYYIINFKNTWIKSFCPKLITLRRYPHQGPFKTEIDMDSAYNIVTEPA
jgi:hypothetical protein